MMMPHIPFFSRCCARSKTVFTVLALAVIFCAAHAVPAERLSAWGDAVPWPIRPARAETPRQTPVAAAPARGSATDPTTEPAAHPSRPLDPALAGKEAVHPDLYWLLDSPAQSTLADVLQATKRNAFSPWPSFWPALRMEGLPRECGTFWMRFELAPSAAPTPKTDAAPDAGGQSEAGSPSPVPLVLDLNTRVFGQTAGRTQVWLAAAGAADGTQIIPTRAGLYPLPSHSNQISTIYIRTEGLPGPGFAPVVRAADGADGSAGFDIVRALFITLAVGVLLCLVRGVFERREWRLWAALYALAVGVHAFWGLPASATGIIRLWDMPGLLAPGVALFLLPHVGRHLMRTRERAPYLDMQLVLLALPGIPLTLIPLMPGHAWTMRYLPLWPALILLLLPTVLAACIRRLPAAGRFLLTCLIAIASLAAFPPQIESFLDAAGHPERMNWLSLAPLACLTVSVLLFTLMRAPRYADVTRKERTGQSDTSERARRQNDPLLLPHSARIMETDGRTDRQAAADAALPRLEMRAPVPHGVSRPTGTPLSLTPEREEPPLPLDPAWRQGPPSPASEYSRRPDAEALEQRMRAPLDAVLREICAIDQAHLPADARRHADALNQAGRRLAECIGSLSHPDASHPDTPRPARPTRNETCRKDTFDLQELMLKTHNSLVEEANARNLALSWFTAPYLPRSYEGDGETLAGVLHMLAESAVRATQRGVVHIRVQRVPESTDPGHLLFTITDSGTGAPPLTRGSLALVRAWELVGRCGGAISMESGPTGTSVSFSIRLTAHVPHAAASTLSRPAERPSPNASERIGSLSPRLSGRPGRLAGTSDTTGAAVNGPAGTLPDMSGAPDDAKAAAAPSAGALRIILASHTPANRRLLAYYLDELPHEVREARGTEEAREIYVRSPGTLLIFDDDIPEDDVIRAVAAIRLFEGEQNIPLASILALSGDDAKSERLRRAGCTHVLRTPVSRKELRLLALRLAPVPRSLRAAFTGEASARPDARPALRLDGTSRAASMNTVAKQPTGSGVRPVYPARASLPVQPLPPDPTHDARPAPDTRAAEEAGRARQHVSENRAPAETREWRPVWKREKAQHAPDQAAPETPRPSAEDMAEARDTAVETASPAEAVLPTSSEPLRTSEPQAAAPHQPAATERPPQDPELPAPPRRRSWKDILFGRRAPAPEKSPLRPLAEPDQSPNSAVEWVGEPTPILKPAQTPTDKPRPAPTPFVFSAPEDAVEWVGEPMPIIRATPQDTADNTSSASEDSRAGTMPAASDGIPPATGRTGLPTTEARPTDMHEAPQPDAPYADTTHPAREDSISHGNAPRILPPRPDGMDTHGERPDAANTVDDAQETPVIDLTEAHLVEPSGPAVYSDPAGSSSERLSNREWLRLDPLPHVETGSDPESTPLPDAPGSTLRRAYEQERPVPPADAAPFAPEADRRREDAAEHNEIRSQDASEPELSLSEAAPRDPNWLRKVPDLSLDPQTDTHARPHVRQDTVWSEPLVLTDRLSSARPEVQRLEVHSVERGEQSIADLAEALRNGKQEILHGQSSTDRNRIGTGAGHIAAAAEGLALHTLADLAHCVEEYTRTDAAEDLHSLLDELLTAVDRTLRELGL